ncbi:MAG: DUF1638 domain-containing protein [Methanomicrobia archaeon]|nr:DUF1638 domain-containing protein [Methanomicrobia archaeon]
MHLGIITCEILRKEVRALVQTAGVRDLYFVVPDAANSVTVVFYQRVIERFVQEFANEDVTIRTNTLPRIRKELEKRQLRDSVIVKVLELRMHDRPYDLRHEIEDGIMRMGAFVDLIVLGYGLCGSTEQELERMIAEAEVPVLIPRDKDGTILNNCIEIVLSRERVQELMAEEVGTFFMTPVGAALIKEPQVILKSTINIMAGKMKPYAVGDTKRVLQLMKNHYHRVVKIVNSEADERDKAYAETVKRFASKFNLEIKQEQGSENVLGDLLDANSNVKKISQVS